MIPPETAAKAEGKSRNWGGKRPNSGRPRAPGESYEAARRRKESALADLRQLEVRRRAGELLDAEATRREWEDTLRRVKSAVLAVVSRIRVQLPHLGPSDLLVLDQELRAALTELGQGGGDGDGDGGGALR